MMIVLGYILAVLMGLTLGLIGAGGSILTVPILVYLLGVKPTVATGYSLLVVGCAALAGAVRYWRRGLVNLRAAATFATPAMLMVLATRRYIVPSLPATIVGAPKDIGIMLMFAMLMMAAAMFMLRPLKEAQPTAPVLNVSHVLKLLLGSAGVGLLSGMVGAGGGFLIIPTLIALFALPVKEAVGTSLAIIAVNSLLGFRGDVAAGIELDWHLLAVFLSLTLLGMALGTTLSKKIQAKQLRRLFGYFVLTVGLAVLAEEIHELMMI